MTKYNGYLLTWKYGTKPWDNLPDVAQRTQQGLHEHDWWNVSSTKIVPGDCLFVLNQSKSNPGIMGVGWATSSSDKMRDHWLEEKRAKNQMVHFVNLDWHLVLDPDSQSLLTEDEIKTEGLPDKLWNARNSGNGISDVVLERLEEAWHEHVGQLIKAPPALPFGDLEFQEGGTKYATHRKHERNARVVAAAKARAIAMPGGLTCCACGFDFEAAYGAHGEGYIEGHHEIPVSTLTEGSTTKVSDIKLVCANCHRMIHRKKDEWLTIDELKAIMADAKASS